MDTQFRTFPAKIIGYALAASVILCLALPCIAVAAYALLTLLSLVANYIGDIVYYIACGPYLIIKSIFFGINLILCRFFMKYWMFCDLIIFPLIIIAFISTLLHLPQIVLESISELPEGSASRQIAIYALGFWLICVVTAIIFYCIGFYNGDANHGAALASYATSSWSSIIDFFLRYKIYIFAWVPVVITVLPTIVINGAIILYRLSRIAFAVSCTALSAVAFGAAILFKVVCSGLYRLGSVLNRILLAGLLGLIIIVDWLFSKRKIRRICPNRDCGYTGVSSVYLCPHCGKILTNLKPSIDGIFYTNCPHCGREVSSSCLTGRDKYTLACPKCHNTWEYFNFGKIPTSVFIIEGAPQSGKTSLLVQMLIQWSSHFSEHVNFLIDKQKKAVKQLGASIDENNFCPSTTRLSHPEAYVMRCNKRFHSFLTYFYDTGGDSLYLQAGVAEPYFNLADGIFLVIDPWAERSILDALREKKGALPEKYRFSKQDADAVIGRLCSNLEHIFAKPGNFRFNIPVCVIVTKCDIHGLSKEMGVPNGFSQSSNAWKESSMLVEEYLTDHGLYNFVNVVKTRFKKNAFFAVSVVDDARSNQSSVLNPLLWMTYNVQR